MGNLTRHETFTIDMMRGRINGLKERGIYRGRHHSLFFRYRRNDWNGKQCNGHPHINTMVLKRDGWKSIFTMTNSLIIGT